MKMDECLDFIEKYKRKSLNTNKLQKTNDLPEGKEC